ncbi:MAG: JAB domain-containing protein [Actinomycetota bacterium]
MKQAVSHLRIVDLPDSERPRERLARVGASGLSDRELLALVLGTGGKQGSALDVAGRLLAESNCLAELSRLKTEELSAVATVGSAKAGALVAAFELGRRAAAQSDRRKAITGPGDLAALVMAEFGAARVEKVLVVVLNKANKPLRIVTLTSGSQDSCLMPVRDALAAVLRHGGVGFAIAHNHPSGNPTPSAEDIFLTKEMLAGAKAVGLRLVDHLVVGAGSWCSLNESGYLSPG